MAATTVMDRTFTSPLQKLLRFFVKSRDEWKAKHHAVKEKLKREQNQRRAVEKSRSQWRAKADAANQRVQELERELAEVKNQPD